MRNLIRSSVLVLLLVIPVAAQQRLNLTLEQSIDIALKRSKALAIAEERLREAEARVGEARAGFFPQLNIKSSYTRLDVAPYITMAKFQLPFPIPGGMPSKITIGDDENYAAILSLQQPLFTGFKILNGYKMAEYGAEAEEYNYKKTKSELIFKVKEAYYGVLKAQEFKKVSQGAVQQMKAHVQDLDNMYKVGLIAKNDLLKAQVQLSNVELMLIKATNAVKMAKTAFCSLLGIPLDTELTLESHLEYQPMDSIKLEDAIQQALKNRPELKAMEYTLKAGEKAVSVAKSSWLPNIFLIGNYNYKRPNRELERKFYRSWDVTVAVQMNIWDWGSIYYRTSQAKHRLKQLQEAYKQLQDGIVLEVTQSYLGLMEAQQKVQATEKNVGQAEENFRVTHEKFKQGMVTNTELLDAQTMLTQAKVEYINALADYNIAKARLMRAMGILRR